MAFNFNWSPLTADTSFYTRAQDLLTAALNKSPKPPIIVDDIIVSELNLGSVPPDLEILEIGDLAEDRFRGIFKMCYTGDAFLTLKTRVQANPLNTYLSMRPSFASVEPLAAQSGLTIPIKITLSDIRLSAFIILVFSKQKGLTLVFRNDPLESLKVSSTFDSIPFVRNYLQKEIEEQLRRLLMDEVPPIIHRLSLRLWNPEYRAQDDHEMQAGEEANPKEKVIDPLASPPQDLVDMNRDIIDSTQTPLAQVDSTFDTYSQFSQKNILRLAALNDSQRTLSLFTPGMRDVVFRAWAGPTERGEYAAVHSPTGPSLSRKHSEVGHKGTTYSFSAPSEAGSASRPGMPHASSYTGSSLPMAKHGKPGRKRKNRIINLRKQGNADDGASVSGESTMTGTMSSAASESGLTDATSLSRERDDELVTPPPSPPRVRKSPPTMDPRKTPQPPRQANVAAWEPLDDFNNTPKPPPPPTFDLGVEANHSTLQPPISQPYPTQPQPRPQRPKPSRYFKSFQFPPEGSREPSSASRTSFRQSTLAAPFPYMESSPGGILEQAWMLKMAGEIARRLQEQKGDFGQGPSHEEEAPPAYKL